MHTLESELASSCPDWNRNPLIRTHERGRDSVWGSNVWGSKQCPVKCPVKGVLIKDVCLGVLIRGASYSKGTIYSIYH